MNAKVAVAMSGGVDSSVTAALLQQKGYEVIGITLQLWEEPSLQPDGKRRKSPADDAEAVADILGIPHYVLDAKDLFKRHVIDYFIESYKMGNTPNPCVACNKIIKFGKLWEEAQRLGAEFLATGHYARIAYDAERGVYTLRRGHDKRKDQSYVLYQLTQNLLPHILFPMAELEKSDVRTLARQWNLPVYDKPESQDICFIPDGDYKNFLRNARPCMFHEGQFIDKNGTVVGRHQGIPAYTIGQRRGLHLGGPGGPYYVTALDVPHNAVVVGSKDELFSDTVYADHVSWVEGNPSGTFSALGKIRYAAKEALCIVYPGEDGICVKFKQPQRAVTPGQSLVLYDAETGDRVLGGGIIAGSKK